MMHMVKRTALALLAGLIVLGATGCNTVRGVGQDLKKAGEAIKRSAD